MLKDRKQIRPLGRPKGFKIQRLESGLTHSSGISSCVHSVAPVYNGGLRARCDDVICLGDRLMQLFPLFTTRASPAHMHWHSFAAPLEHLLTTFFSELHVYCCSSGLGPPRENLRKVGNSLTSRCSTAVVLSSRSFAITFRFQNDSNWDNNNRVTQVLPFHWRVSVVSAA